MADINDYQGNANLAYGTSSTGGGPIGAYKFTDTMDAWSRFAAYNFTADRDKYFEANRQKDLLAQEAGRLLPFKYGNMMDNDKAQIDKAVEDYTQYFTENPTAVRLEIGPDGKVKNAKEHAELIKRQQNIDQMITRANVRKTQDAALQKQIADIADPDKRTQAEAWWNNEKNTPIDKDLRLFPAFEMFNPQAFFKDLMPGDIKFDELQRNPNDVVKVTTTLTNVGEGLNKFNMQYTANFKGVRKHLDDILNSMNEVIRTSKDENGKLDMNKLKKHPQGSSILSMMDAANSFMTFYNNAVDKGQVKMDKLEPVTLDDELNIDELGKLFMSSNIGMSTTRTLQETDDSLEQQRLALQRRGLDIEQQGMNLRVKEYKDRNNPAGGEIGNYAWWQLAKTAQEGDKTRGELVSGTVYQNAFADNTGQKRKETVKQYNEDGKEIGSTVEEVPVKRAPTYVRVIADPGGDPNKFSVRAYYKDENGKYYNKDFSATEAYNQMQYISGKDSDVKALSEMNTKYRTDVLKSKTVDFGTFDRHFSNPEKPVSTSSTYIYNGKTYTHAELRKKYSDEQIKEAVKRGVFKTR